MTGLESSIRLGPIGPVPSAERRLEVDGSDAAFRSAPAQNVPFAPCRTATCASWSASKRANASASAAAVARSTAFRA
jgi:hypothetical protein